MAGFSMAWVVVAAVSSGGAGTANKWDQQSDDKRLSVGALSDHQFEVRAWWDNFESSQFKLFETHPELAGFAPEQPAQDFSAGVFTDLLPTEVVEVGDVWQLPATVFLPFLRQLHSGAAVKLRQPISFTSAAPIAAASLRAANDRFLEIITRVHAEFLLERTDEREVWFTPAQFAGRLVLDRVRNRVHSFHLTLPPRDSNVDVQIMRRRKTQPGEPPGPPLGGYIDIGFLPRMELFGGAPLPHNVRWDAEVHEDDARLRLAQEFYPHLRVDWLDLEEAVEEAQTLELPLHVLVCFGTFHDEAC